MVRKISDEKAAAPQPAAQTAAPSAQPAAAAAGSVNVIAHIPGTITRIMKTVGAAVAYGEPIMVYQTGDVEIEIPATASGTIRSINVGSGTAIVQNSLLANNRLISRLRKNKKKPPDTDVPAVFFWLHEDIIAFAAKNLPVLPE